MENLEIIEHRFHILTYENKIRDPDQFLCYLEALRFLTRHLAKILKTKCLQKYLLDNLVTPVWKQLKNIKYSFAPALGKACVCPKDLSSATQRWLDVRSKRRMRTNEHFDACETPRRMKIQHQPLLLHCTGVRKSWSDWAVGGQIYLWVLELKLQSWPWMLAVTPEIGHVRASWSVSLVYCSHFCDCCAEALLFLSIAPKFYASLITVRKKKKKPTHYLIYSC